MFIQYFKNNRFLLFTLIISVILRLIYLLEIIGTPITEILLIDSETYHRFAQLILKGQFNGEKVYSMNILYPYFLAGIYKIFGVSIYPVFIIQILLDTISIFLVYQIAKLSFNVTIAKTSSFIAAIYAPFIFYTSTILTPTLINFLILSAIYGILLYKENKKNYLLILSGILIGIAILGRGNSILLVPFVITFILLNGIITRKIVITIIAFFITALLPSIVVSVRNYYVEKKVVPIAANYGAFYIGHNSESTGLYTLPSFIGSAAYESEVLGVQAAVSNKVGKSLTLAETSDYLFKQGFYFILENPLKEIGLLSKKFYYFWNDTEAPTNLNFYFSRDFSVLLKLNFITFGIIGSLGLLGILLCFHHWKRHFLLFSIIIVYLATCLLFFFSSEYRMPAVPIIIIFASFSIYHIRELIIVRKQKVSNYKYNSIFIKQPYIILLLFIVFSVFVNYRIPLLQNQRKKKVDYLNFGNLYNTQNEFNKAIIMLEKSIAIDPEFGPAYRSMAEISLKTGNIQQANHYQQKALTLGLYGQYAQVSAVEQVLNSANTLFLNKQYEGALKQYFKSLEIINDKALENRIMANIGLCYYRMKRYTEAKKIIEDVLRVDPNNQFAIRNLNLVNKALEKPK